MSRTQETKIGRQLMLETEADGSDTAQIIGLSREQVESLIACFGGKNQSVQ